MFSRPAPEIRRVRRLTLVNRHGLHARPASELVRCASAFASTITIKSNGKCYRADRVMEVVLANLNQGDSFMIEALGPDAIEAVERIAQLLLLLKEAEEKDGKCYNTNDEIVD